MTTGSPPPSWISRRRSHHRRSLGDPTTGRRSGTSGSPDRAAARRAVAAAVDEVIRRAMSLGGSMEYVHGVGVKLAYLLGDELGAGLAVARRVKAALDPANTLNPGKAGF